MDQSPPTVENRIVHRRRSPAHTRVADEIRRRIVQGTLSAGSVLPSRRALAEELDTAVGTVQKAVADLTADGTLIVRGRWGTFVAGASGQANKLAGPTVTKPIVQAPSIDRMRAPASDLSVAVVACLNCDPNSRQHVFWTRTILMAIERAITASGGRSIFKNLYLPDGSEAPVVSAVEAVVSQGVNAVFIVFPPDLDKCLSLASVVDQANLPVILVGLDTASYPFYSVYYDSRDAGCQAATHLIRGGAQSLMFFSPFTARWVEDRALGVRDAARQYNLPAEAMQIVVNPVLNVDEHWHDYLTDDTEHEAMAYEYAKKLFNENIKASGVIAANDFLAYGYMRAAAEHGLIVGKDYTIVGFDDAPRSFELGLSTLQPPLEDIGCEAVEVGIRAMRRERAVLRSCMHSKLVERMSGRFETIG